MFLNVPFVTDKVPFQLHGDQELYLWRSGIVSQIYELTVWSRLLLEKLILPQLVRQLPTFYGPESPLPFSHEPTTCPYSEPDKYGSTPPPIPVFCRSKEIVDTKRN
jgi:hypothetical protein